MAKTLFSDPFIPARITPVTIEGVGEHNKIAVTVKDDSGEEHVAGILSKDYNLIQNSLAHDVASDVFSRSNHEWTDIIYHQGKPPVYFDGKRYMHHFCTKEPIYQLETNHRLHLGALLRNSYDGTSCFGFDLFILNMACTNAYHSRQRFGFFAIKHITNGDKHFDLEDAVDNLRAGAERAIAIAPHIDRLTSMPLTVDHIIKARNSINMPTSKWGSVLGQLSTEQHKSSLFGLFQALTFVATAELSGMASISVGNLITDSILDEKFSL